MAAALRPTATRLEPPPAAGRLLRVLGVAFGLAVTIGNTIGAGILRTPGEIAGRLPHSALFIAIWLAGGLYALLCSLSIAEIATMLPQSGGHYIYARYTFGEYAGFIVGWNDWLSVCGSIAAVSIIVGEYVGLLYPPLAGHNRGLAMLVVLVFGLMQWKGIRWGNGVQQVTSLLKALIFAGLVVACFLTAGHAAPSTAPPAIPREWTLVSAIVLSLQAVIYTYDGWTGVIYFSEEVRNPARDIPRSMFGGIFSVIGIYVLLNLALLHVLPVTIMAGDPLPLASAARLMWGAHADTVLQAVVIVSMLSAINAFELMACRTLFAMSRDRLFFRPAAHVNSGGTPDTALLFSTLAAALFIGSETIQLMIARVVMQGGRLLALLDSVRWHGLHLLPFGVAARWCSQIAAAPLGSLFDKIIAALAFFFVFNYVMGLTAVMVLRRREPEHSRPYRAWGYPWTTTLAWCGSVAFFAGAIYTDTANSIFALLVLAASFPVFWIIRWKQRAVTPVEER